MQHKPHDTKRVTHGTNDAMHNPRLMPPNVPHTHTTGHVAHGTRRAARTPHHAAPDPRRAAGNRHGGAKVRRERFREGVPREWRGGRGGADRALGL